ncbi:hypothetical protein ACJX0J_005675, partial [Zea mays]
NQALGSSKVSAGMESQSQQLSAPKPLAATSLSQTQSLGIQEEPKIQGKKQLLFESLPATDLKYWSLERKLCQPLLITEKMFAYRETVLEEAHRGMELREHCRHIVDNDDRHYRFHSLCVHQGYCDRDGHLGARTISWAKEHGAAATISFVNNPNLCGPGTTKPCPDAPPFSPPPPYNPTTPMQSP